MVKDILSNFGTLESKLKYITLDFEVVLIKVVQVIFPQVKLIGCLFYFKQAMWREAQKLGLTTLVLKNATAQLILSLGSLCWEDQFDVDNKFKKVIEEYNKVDQHKLVNYYEKNWLPELKSGLIDYTEVEDNYRANSVLEQYNEHIKDCLPRLH